MVEFESLSGSWNYLRRYALAPKNVERIRTSRLFDAQYYLSQAGLRPEQVKDPLLHYLQVGAAKGWKPHRWFDPDFYRQRFPGVSRPDALLHFLEHGLDSGADPHPFFDSAFYMSEHPDVAGSDMPAFLHFIVHGAGEGRTLRPPPGRPATFAERLAQNPAARNGDDPFAFESHHAALREGTTETLDIVFSLSFRPEGEFSFANHASANTQLFLNVRDNDSYQRGIPGISSSIDETAAWLRRVVAHLGSKVVRTMGESMGGYGAMLFGHLIEADAIYASGPFVKLGHPFCRSREWYRNPSYDPRYQDISAILPGLQNVSRIVFPVYDLFDYQQMRCFLDWPKRSLFYRATFHPGNLNWSTVMAATDLLEFEDGIGSPPRHAFLYDDRQMEQLWEAYVAIRERRRSEALDLLEEVAPKDPLNYGVWYRLGVQQALAGDDASAHRTLRKAMVGLWGRNNIVEDKPRYDAEWRRLLAADYSGCVTLAELKRLTGLFREIWND